MEKVLSSDLPPAYCTLSLSPEESAIAANADSGRDTEHLISNSFDNKDNRVIFTQKVLAIVLLQKLAVGTILGTCLYNGVEVNNFLWLISMMLWWSALFSIFYAEHIKKRKIYDFTILAVYPFTVAFVVVTLPVLLCNSRYEYQYGENVQWMLLKVFVSAWITYIVAGIAVLFYSIFSLDSKHEFKLRHKIIITSVVFPVLYVCMSIPLFIYSEFDVTVALIVSLFLYLNHLYVLYDIDTMTGSNYRRPLTPDDYVTGAVNLHVDFLFIIKSFICKICSRYCDE